MITDQPTIPKQKLRWYQYSLRTLMIVVTLFAVACSWFAVKMGQAKRQREIVETLKQLSCEVHYEYEFVSVDSRNPRAQPPVPAWLREFLGVDFFSNVNEVVIGKKGITDSGWECLKKLTELRWLSLGENMSNAELDHLKEMKKIQGLQVGGTILRPEQFKAMKQLKAISFWTDNITDDDLVYFKEMKDLQTLHLSGYKFTGTGLVHLKDLKQLRYLQLSDTGVTDTGLEQIKGLTQLQTLDLSVTNITDAGLVHLKGLSQLNSLAIIDTKITDAGLVHLKGLTQLKYLFLAVDQVTDAGVQDLQKALPNLKIYR